MHTLLNNVGARYGLNKQEVFQAVYAKNWKMMLDGYHLSYNIPADVALFCIALLQKP